METTGHSLMLIGFTLGLFIFGTVTTGAQSSQSAWMKDSQAKLETELVQKHGEGERSRSQRGLAQVANFWRSLSTTAGMASSTTTSARTAQEIHITVFSRSRRNSMSLASFITRQRGRSA